MLSRSCIYLPFSTVIVTGSSVPMGMVAVLAIAPSMFFFASPVISLHIYLQSKHSHTIQCYLPPTDQCTRQSLNTASFQPVSNSFAAAWRSKPRRHAEENNLKRNTFKSKRHRILKDEKGRAAPPAARRTG